MSAGSTEHPSPGHGAELKPLWALGAAPGRAGAGLGLWDHPEGPGCARDSSTVPSLLPWGDSRAQPQSLLCRPGASQAGGMGGMQEGSPSHRHGEASHRDQTPLATMVGLKARQSSQKIQVNLQGIRKQQKLWSRGFFFSYLNAILQPGVCHILSHLNKKLKEHP